MENLAKTAGTAIAIGGLWVQYVAIDTEPRAPGIISAVLVCCRVVAIALNKTDVANAILLLAYSILLANSQQTPGSWIAGAGLYISILAEVPGARRTFQPL